MNLTLSQVQAACLLANAFFCTFPQRKQKDGEYSSYPSINFNTLFHGNTNTVDNLQCEKLDCILNYFRGVFYETPTGALTFSRQIMKNKVDWKKSKKTLCDLHVSQSGTIEEDGRGMLQVISSSRDFGGDVLEQGELQEEILLLLYPEMILGRLFTEHLLENECLIMTGCECFNTHRVHSRSFKFTGSFKDTTERDEWGRRFTRAVAIDAFQFESFTDQYEEQHIIRELNKAYCGFMSPDNRDTLPAVATGNWRCGKLNNVDVQLKALIQILAATQAGRDVCYFTFGDEDFYDKLTAVYSELKASNNTISDFMKLIRHYSEYLHTQSRHRLSLFDYILKF